MRIKLANGQEVEVSEQEAAKLAGEAWNEPHVYLHRAQENLEKMTKLPAESEDDLKEILYRIMPGITKEQADMLYEVVEAAIGRFATKSM